MARASPAPPAGVGGSGDSGAVYTDWDGVVAELFNMGKSAHLSSARLIYKLSSAHHRSHLVSRSAKLTQLT